MIDPNATFQTDATDTAGFFQDLARFSMNHYALKGLIPASTGVSAPSGVSNVTDANSYVEMLGGLMANQPTLDPIDAPVQNTYRQRRYDFLSSEEGVRNFAYDDKTGQQIVPGQSAKGNVTVGVGFNMDDPSAKQRFAAALPGVDFDAVHNGQQQLTDPQVQRLFDANIRDTEALINQQLAGRNIPEHQRIALVSLAFNNPSIAKQVMASLPAGNAATIASILTSAGSSTRRVREAAMFAGPAEADTTVPIIAHHLVHGVPGLPPPPAWLNDPVRQRLEPVAGIADRYQVPAMLEFQKQLAAMYGEQH